MRNLSYENEFCTQFHFHANQSHFHKNGFSLRLLKQSYKGTWKWPIFSVNAAYVCRVIHDRRKLLFVGQFKLMTEMFHITHSALHIGLTTTLQHYNSIYRSDMFNVLSAFGNTFFVRLQSRDVFLCFVAIVWVRVYYVDVSVFFVLRHWWVSQILTPRMSPSLSELEFLAGCSLETWCGEPTWSTFSDGRWHFRLVYSHRNSFDTSRRFSENGTYFLDCRLLWVRFLSQSFSCIYLFNFQVLCKNDWNETRHSWRSGS